MVHINEYISKLVLTFVCKTDINIKWRESPITLLSKNMNILNIVKFEKFIFIYLFLIINIYILNYYILRVFHRKCDSENDSG